VAGAVVGEEVLAEGGLSGHGGSVVGAGCGGINENVVDPLGRYPTLPRGETARRGWGTRCGRSRFLRCAAE
jgi:hypothetical protein